jgi:hypothetical protein
VRAVGRTARLNLVRQYEDTLNEVSTAQESHEQFIGNSPFLSGAGLRAFYLRLRLRNGVYDQVANFGLLALGIAALYWTTKATLTACCGPPALSVTFTDIV